MSSPEPSVDAMLRDLDIQWRDHFHMRDQTWKILGSSLLLFAGVVGLDMRESSQGVVMLIAYSVVILTAMLGWGVAWHHRLRQKQKFAIIEIYEKRLGLYDLKQPVLSGTDARPRSLNSIFTVRFIELTELGLAVLAAALLVRRLAS